MPTFRYLVATSLSVAIALNNTSASANPLPTDHQPSAHSDSLHPDSGRVNAQQHTPESTEIAQARSGEDVPSVGDTPLRSPSPRSLEPETPPPANLEPSPNPLLFPTRPGEVEITDTVPITLEQAYDLARRNNLQLQETQLELDRSRQALREARAALYPTVDAQAALTRTDSAQGDLTNDQIEEQNEGVPENLQRDLIETVSTNLTGQVQLSYDLYTSGERSARINSAERQMRFNELEVERISEQIRLDVATAYYDLQQRDEDVRINQAAVRNAQKSLEDAQALERAGVGTQFDVLRADVNRANAQQDLTQSLGDQRVARRRLAQLLNVSQTANLVTADEVEVSGLWEFSLEQTIVAAFKNRADLEQQLVQREISEQQRKLALSRLGPQVRLTASYNVLNDLEDDFGFADGSTVQALVNWRLFDGGAARAAARQAEINAEIADTRFAEQRNQVRFDVERFYSDLSANLESIQTAEKALEQAQESLELARLRFQAGVGTQTEVIDSETDLTRAEGNLSRSIIDYNRALVNLKRAVSNFPFVDPAIEDNGS
jgi:outer membrane protein TolC